MVDSTLGWGLGHPLAFVGILALVAMAFGAMVAPRFRQALNRDHPRC